MTVRFARGYFRRVDAITCWLGRVLMYGIVVTMAIPLWSSISKSTFLPALRVREPALLALVACCIPGAQTRHFFANISRRNARPDALKALLTPALEQSHYYRQWRYLLARQWRHGQSGPTVP